MYTIYSDLLIEGITLQNDLIINKVKATEMMNKQKERDQYIKIDLCNNNIKFPMNEEDINNIIPYFFEKTTKNTLLNFLLIKKDEDEQELEVKIISNGSINIRLTQKDALDFILHNDNKSQEYALLYNKMC